MVVALLNLAVQKFRRKVSWLDWRQLVPDLFNGAAIPPFLLLVFGASLFPELLALVERVSRPTLFLAGLVALLALLDISFRSEPSPAGA
jgi:hypothetical protein